MAYDLLLHCRTGTRSLTHGSDGPCWSYEHEWITWTTCDTEAEADSLGRILHLSNPRECRGWRVRPHNLPGGTP